jgi:hypothetical protein
MSIYAPRKIPELVTAGWVIAELAAIAAAHNTHSAENFPEKCIPLSAVDHKWSYWVEVLQGDDVGSAAIQYAQWAVPVDCVLDAVSFTCSTSTSYGIGTITVLRGGVPTVLTTHAINVACYTASVGVGLSPGDVINFEADGISFGTLGIPTATLLLRALHTI